VIRNHRGESYLRSQKIPPHPTPCEEAIEEALEQTRRGAIVAVRKWYHYGSGWASLTRMANDSSLAMIKPVGFSVF
jgi:hypothetical protein